jgi:hypothetical protein
MAVVAVAGLVCARIHRREMERESDRRSHRAKIHEFEESFWRDLNPRYWTLIHKAVIARPSSMRPISEDVPSEEEFYIMGQPPFGSGRAYRDLGELDWERAQDVIGRMTEFHRAMATKWRQASRSPGTPVEPDPPPPASVDRGTILIF